MYQPDQKPEIKNIEMRRFYSLKKKQNKREA